MKTAIDYTVRIPLIVGQGGLTERENVLLQQTLVHLVDSTSDDPMPAIQKVAAEIRPIRLAYFLYELYELGGRLEEAASAYTAPRWFAKRKEGSGAPGDET